MEPAPAAKPTIRTLRCKAVLSAALFALSIAACLFAASLKMT